jgi:NADH-ubiquinone oxidoreductase chain 2
MVLSAALNKGFIFLSLVAITTSVISAVYYLNLIKEIFFYSPSYNINPALKNLIIHGSIYDKYNNFIKSIQFKHDNIVISSPIAFTISTITLIILIFMFINKE